MYLYVEGNIVEEYNHSYYSKGESKELDNERLTFEIPESITHLKIFVGDSAHKVEVNSRDTYHKKETCGCDFTITPFYGNCGICILSGIYRDMTSQWELALTICEAMGYSQVLYSVSTGQKTLIEELKAQGFTPLQETLTLNKRSDNDIQLYFKNI